ncbi:SDR family NAD(P)-dependent oxidoreductase [Halobiforma nitratireducens]|uniref:Oxidoreductase n=1 Tax=Halobiforma nitratireducens JCM 10879 TaxID=1227454 RepID=M0MP68_9EURY|nr:SDR family NAD(P)-dependent oxidoreductase [Halobiforma nitratireducens]EMA47158.1 oxidoreductase [Halobiforma nitratireducens JCM 10879]
MKIVLTGAAGGIGGQLARRLAGTHEVIAVDRDSEALDRLPDRIETRPIELTDEQAVREELSDSRIEALVSAVGWYELAALEDCPPASFEKHLATNLAAVHTPIQAVLPAIRKRAGRIVVVGSIVGSVSLPYHGAYSASKAGLDGYVNCLRREPEPRGVDVSLIEPGPVRTGLNERAVDSLEEVPGSAYSDQYSHFDSYSPASTDIDTAVTRIITALESDRPQARYRVGRRARWLPRLQALLPTRLFDRLVRAGLPGGLLYRLIDR